MTRISQKTVNIMTTDVIRFLQSSEYSNFKTFFNKVYGSIESNPNFSKYVNEISDYATKVKQTEDKNKNHYAEECYRRHEKNIQNISNCFNNESEIKKEKSSASTSSVSSDRPTSSSATTSPSTRASLSEGQSSSRVRCRASISHSKNVKLTKQRLSVSHRSLLATLTDPEVLARYKIPLRQRSDVSSSQDTKSFNLKCEEKPRLSHEDVSPGGNQQTSSSQPALTGPLPGRGPQNEPMVSLPMVSLPAKDLLRYLRCSECKNLVTPHNAYKCVVGHLTCHLCKGSYNYEKFCANCPDARVIITFTISVHCP